jgi:ATP adenylyltransferase
MNYSELCEFVQRRMQMSHVYQPVMLLALLQRGGKASKREISEAILSRDQSQLDYYDEVVSGMVGKVLRRHKVVSYQSGVFHLGGFQSLTTEQVDELIRLCESKLEEYVAKRGARIWQHRNHSLNALSGTVRYEILKAAKYRCALCGISAEEKALEVDHIKPRKHGGTDDLWNLQALCYSCNATKRDRDSTDFRRTSEFYEKRESGCPFCEPAAAIVLDENSLAYCLADQFPVTPLHSLIVPKRHTDDYFSLVPAERNALDFLLHQRRGEIREQDPEVSGFNVGINIGESAGQTISHLHVHLIPRRSGDATSPEGGVRGVIPDKAKYR